MADQPSTELNPYPPYVQTDADRARWDASVEAAKSLHPDGDSALLWATTRSLYHSDIPT